jgi:hypothetical protein
MLGNDKLLLLHQWHRRVISCLNSYDASWKILWVRQLGNEWVSEWLLFNANSAIVQLYHGENKLIFNEMMMRSALF